MSLCPAWRWLMSAGPSWAWSMRAGSAGAAVLAIGAAVGVSPAAAVPSSPVPPSPYVISGFAGTRGSAALRRPGRRLTPARLFPMADAVVRRATCTSPMSPNGRVEQVTPAGVLSVIAGDGVGSLTFGPATEEPSCPSPAGVAVARDGTVYVADYGASLVYKISPAGILSIVAGHRLSGSSDPGLATASSGQWAVRGRG